MYDNIQKTRAVYIYCDISAATGGILIEKRKEGLNYY